MSENDKAKAAKAKVKIEDLPVPLKDSKTEKQEEIRGGVNPTTRKPKPDSY